MYGARLTRSGHPLSASPATCERMNKAPVTDREVDRRAAAQRLLKARDWRGALTELEHALAAAPADSMLHLWRAQCLLALGRKRDACEAAAAALRNAPAHAGFWDAVGSVFSYAGDQVRALSAYDRAVELAPSHAPYLFNRAAVRRFGGDLAAAEADYDRVIALQPDDFEAYKNRSDLRPQTAASNHVAELESLASRPPADWRAEVQLRYALAKECEDLGEYERSFRHLTRGSRCRRQHLKYDVAADVATVEWIVNAFPSIPAAAPPAQNAQRPIFIVGLPRSGTTLADRILGSHSQLVSAGELHDFALAIVAAVERRHARSRIPRRELVALSAGLDFAALGADYLARARAAGAGTGRFIDKMPLNYLYCGLIRRALPQATIVHAVRHPMAACYAIYKTLFEDGYPFSYDLDEIASYFIAYRRLMHHWQAAMPGVIYQLSYESLVADQHGETRKLLDHCGLDWEDACGQFHRNPAPSTTQSAAQVRRPLYARSVDQWRHYERELKPLRERLEAAGIDMSVPVSGVPSGPMSRAP